MKKLFIVFFMIAPLPIYAAIKIDFTGSYPVTAAAACGKTAFIGGFDGKIRVINAETSQIISVLSGHKKQVVSISADKDCKYIVSSGLDDIIIIQDIEKAAEIKRIVKSGMGVRGAVMAPDASFVYAAFQNGVHAYKFGTWENTAIIEGFDNGIYSLAVNGNGSLIAAGSKYGDIYIADTKEHEIIKTIKKGSSMITCLNFAANRDILIAGGYDKTAGIYDIRSGKLIKELPFFQDELSGAAISANGEKAGAASKDGSVIIYNLKTGELINCAVEGKGAVTAFAADKSMRFVIYGRGAAFEDERGAVIAYPYKKGVYRKIYSFIDGDIILSESGYISGAGGFTGNISSYRNGNKESLPDIMNRYMKPDKMKVILND